MPAIPRRRFIRTVAGSAAALATLPTAVLGQERRQPNVVLVITDDQGSVDMGCYGATDLITPNMDAIAQRGLRFTDFSVTAPMCTASRASLLTGQHFQRVLTSAGINNESTGIAELYAAAGYRTGFYGKWHLGGPPHDPLGEGFSEFVGCRVGAIDNYSHFAYWQNPPRHGLYQGRQPIRRDGEFFPDIVTRQSRDFIRRAGDDPFLLVVSYNMPHYPLQPESRFLGMYGHASGARRVYGAYLTSLDDKIGQLLTTLDEQGLRDDTIVVVLSDNGHSDEVAAEGGGGSAGPFRGAKKSLWEGGIRVPCVLCWPGHLPEGETRTQTASAMDLLPTLTALCDIPTDGLALDGQDLGPVLRSRTAPTPHALQHWMIGATYWAVREGPWKLVVLHDQPFLANLERDPGETTNLAETEPRMVMRLRRAHQTWLDTGIEPLYSIE